MTTEPGVKPKLPEYRQITPRREETSMGLIAKFSRDESGASAVEYALLLALIAVAITAGVQSFGTTVNGLFGMASAKWPATGS
jgi:pilus assembly protein Flp/PilA